MSLNPRSKRTFGASRALALLPLALLAVLGCGTLIGLDNYTVASGGSGGGVSGGGGGRSGGGNGVDGRNCLSAHKRCLGILVQMFEGTS